MLKGLAEFLNPSTHLLLVRDEEHQQKQVAETFGTLGPLIEGGTEQLEAYADW